MKKIFVALLAFILLFNLLNPVCSYAKENPSLSISSKNAEAGTDVEVDVAIANNPGILGGTFKISFDSKLTLKDASAGEAFSALTMTKPGKFESDCRFVWDGADLEDKDIKDGTILSLTFTVTSEAQPGDKLDIEVSCVEATSRDLSVVNIESGEGFISIPNQEQPPENPKLTSISAVKTKSSYEVGDTLNIDDLTVMAYYSNGSSKKISNYTTNVNKIDMSTPGKKKLVVTYVENNISKVSEIYVQVNLKEIDENMTVLSIDGCNALPGDQITVNVSIKNNPGIIGLILNLQYDDGLILKDAKSGAAFSKLTLTKPGELISGCNFIWDATDINDSDIKDGAILELTFTVSDKNKKDDKLNIKLSCNDAIDRSIVPVDIEILNGVVTVGDSSISNKNELVNIEAKKTKTKYETGEILNVDDIVVMAVYKDGLKKKVTDFTTNVHDIDMGMAGTKTLVISYTEDGVKKEVEISIDITKKEDTTSDGEGTEKSSDNKTEDIENPSDDKKEVDDGQQSVVDDSTKTTPGVGTISADGKTLTDTDGVKYLVAEKIKKKQLKKNAAVADKKSSGKYKITKVTKKKGKITGGTVTYMKPYNKNCKTANIKASVVFGGVTFKVTQVAQKAFKGCKKLTKLTIGKNIKTIGKNAFSGCVKLKSVNCKSTVLTKIGANAFSGDKKLTKITLKTKKLKKKNVGKNAIKGTSKKLVIKVPKKKKKSYYNIFKTKGNKKVTVN